MNLETVTRPMEMFRDQMLRVGAEWAKQGRFMSQSALRSSAHVLAITAERLDVLADRIVPDAATTSDDATPAETVAATPAADALPADAAAPVEATRVETSTDAATPVEVTPAAAAPATPVDAQPAAKTDAQPAQSHHGKKHHRRH